jgi:hypothetical protein
MNARKDKYLIIAGICTLAAIAILGAIFGA